MTDWTGTGTATSTGAGVALITIDDYQRLMNEDVSALPTAYLDDILQTASTELENHCYRTWGVQTTTGESVLARAMTYNRQHVLRMDVERYPLTAVTAVSVWYAVDADATALEVDDVLILPGQRSFVIPFGLFGLWSAFFAVGHEYKAEVSYTAGATVPLAVQKAVALLVQEILALDVESSRDEVDLGSGFQIGAYRETKATRDLTGSDGLGLGTDRSVLAAKLVARYRDEGVVFI